MNGLKNAQEAFASRDKRKPSVSPGKGKASVFPWQRASMEKKELHTNTTLHRLDLIRDPVSAANPPGRPPIIDVNRNRSAGVFVGNNLATFSVRIDCVCTSIYMAATNHNNPTPVKPARKETHPLFPNQKPAPNAPRTSVHQGRKYCKMRHSAAVNKVCFKKLICRVIIGLWNIEIQIVAPE